MPRDTAFLMDILEAAKLAMEYISNKTEEEFLRDNQCQDAVIRRLEIIGEAAARISEQTREEHSDLPWTAMIGMRNIMIHEYDGIDLKIVWETVKKNLPELISSIKKILDVP